MKEVIIAGRSLSLNPQNILGEGGEAEVYDISATFPQTALKIWKPPTHPDFAGSAEDAKRNRDGAKKRIEEYGRKLLEFPKNTPPRLVRPRELAYGRNGRDVIGYCMEIVAGAEVLRSYGQAGFRKKNGIDGNQVVRIMQDLHSSVQALHGQQIIIGDFNSSNVLVTGSEAWLIDADSMQFGKYPARSFTTRFVDPLICDPTLNHLLQVAHHSPATDWYAFALMLFECLLYYHPYGGVYTPKDKANQLPLDARPLKRISVLNPDVITPSKGISFTHLPDDLLHFYSQLLEKDQRGTFPLNLLNNLRWTTCSNCGIVHARSSCPSCAQAVPLVRKKVRVLGKVTADRMFQTSGTLIEVAAEKDVLQTLCFEQGVFKREQGTVLLKAPQQPSLQFRIWGRKTVIAYQGQIVVIDENGNQVERLSVDTFRGRKAVFEVNNSHLYWVAQGRLLRDDTLGPRFIGNVLQGQTLFWMGQNFGFGVSRAGELQLAFVFDAQRTGINDSVKLPPFKGEWIGARAYFSSSHCWFFTAEKYNGRVHHNCYLIASDGSVIATAAGNEDDGSWLGALTGKVAVTLNTAQGPKQAIFAATDNGLVRVEADNGQLFQSAHFPDTRDFVSTDDRLFADSKGLLVAGKERIDRITIK